MPSGSSGGDALASMSQASRSIDERLRKMRDQGSTLDKRLHGLAEESKRWHQEVAHGLG